MATSRPPTYRSFHPTPAQISDLVAEIFQDKRGKQRPLLEWMISAPAGPNAKRTKDLVIEFHLDSASNDDPVVRRNPDAWLAGVKEGQSTPDNPGKVVAPS